MNICPLLLVFLGFFWLSCEKDPSLDPPVKCIEALYYKEDVISEVDSLDAFHIYSLRNIFPDYGYRKIFIPSAYTPNGDFLNDRLLICIYILRSAMAGWEAKWNISRSGVTIIDTRREFTGGMINIEWDGKDIHGNIVPAQYDVHLEIYHNGNLYKTCDAKTWLLLPGSNGKLPAWATCLVYADQFDARLGLLYSTAEQFD